MNFYSTKIIIPTILIITTCGIALYLQRRISQTLAEKSNSSSNHNNPRVHRMRLFFQRLFSSCHYDDDDGEELAASAATVPDTYVDESVVLTQNSKVYGIPLAKVIDVENQKLPPTLATLMAWIEQYAMNFDGLFRLVGVRSEVLALAKQFEADPNYRISADEDVRVVAGVFKRYLSCLPDMFLTTELSPHFCEAKANVPKLQELIAQLPPPNRIFLEQLISFLHRVTLHSAQNNMNSKNLGIIFGMALCSPPGAPPEQTFIASSAYMELFKTFIDNVQTLFPAAYQSNIAAYNGNNGSSSNSNNNNIVASSSGINNANDSDNGNNNGSNNTTAAATS